MIVLGIHMGHDAAATVIADGVVRSLVAKERHARIKHAAVATITEIDRALSEAGVGLDAIDAVAVTTTHNWPFLFADPGLFRLEYAPDLTRTTRGAAFMSDRWASFAVAMAREERTARQRLVNLRGYPDTAPLFGRDVDPTDPRSEVLCTRQFPVTPDGWSEVGAPGAVLASASSLYRDRNWRDLLVGAFHVPIACTIRGRRVPGAVIPHHLAHAAGAFYQSDAERAVVVTCDGGYRQDRYGHAGGLYCVGEGKALYPLWFNHSHAGNLYRRVAEALGMRGIDGAGKLTELAPYGRPRFHDDAFVGTFPEVNAKFPNDPGRVVDLLYDSAWPYIRRAAADARREVGALPVPDPMAPFARDLAASVQETFVRQMLGLARTAHGLAGVLNAASDVLCLAGGCALNAPANGRVRREGPFRRVFVPPACDDSGLAMGAAFYVAHALAGDPRAPQGAETGGLAYRGRRIGEGELRRALDRARGGLLVEEGIDAPARAAGEVEEGRIIGWVEGRAEAGPRALGHRSIVADARVSGSRECVNRIKGREHWRPMASAVLIERRPDWFEGGPPATPDMGFTSTVLGDALPAVTHMDGSACVQTVDATCGGFRRLIEAFEARTGVPVVVNASLNVAGEPMADSADDALALLRQGRLDTLYIDGRRIARRPG